MEGPAKAWLRARDFSRQYMKCVPTNIASTVAFVQHVKRIFMGLTEASTRLVGVSPALGTGRRTNKILNHRD